ncbi:CHRD domain-containing protein, partial [candidate division KSB1 bacterium]|nr:CHRD domain-containing protein [candidate division KSB1 bacterium]NIR68901.1 CHRD domain-containing protein [candidate division KSB1 bacterium]NIS24026.1 CHRD domain-containing protein [candidate division KSB1 bacterium]NIT73190.1 CHRD domain-containing protein [candidate division KSB1 bacterium]NIU24676.1 CHRD domain-containing protein [candidate division KSB1 bacterium]
MKTLQTYLIVVFFIVAALQLSGCGETEGTILQASAVQKSSDDDDDLEFKVDLTGDQEVPPVTTATTGEAEFEVNSDLTEIKFELEIEDAMDILAVAGAHIHCAPANQNGPIVAFLAGEVPGGFDGEVKIEGTLTDANIIDDACGATISELVQSMKDGNAYVNVHSAANPAGEVRGQFGSDEQNDKEEDDDDEEEDEDDEEEDEDDEEEGD